MQHEIQYLASPFILKTKADVSHTTSTEYDKSSLGESLVSILRQVIKENAQEPIGLTLSGGLDSGSIYTTCKDLNFKVKTFTHVPKYRPDQTLTLDRIGDERELIKSYKLNDHLAFFLDSRDSHPLDAIDFFVEKKILPVHGMSNMHWMLDVYKKAQEEKIKTLLVGQVGNFTVSWQGITPDPKGRIKAIYNHLLFNYIAKKKFLDVSFLDKNKINLAQLETVNGLNLVNPFSKRLLVQYRRNHLNLMRAITQTHYRQIERIFGFKIFDPTASQEIIKFCLSVNNSQYHNGLENKLLFKNAFSGKIPDSILANTKKGLQSADLNFLIQERAEETFDVLEDLKRDSLLKNIIDWPSIFQFVKSCEKGDWERFSYSKANSLFKTIAIGKYTRKHGQIQKSDII